MNFRDSIITHCIANLLCSMIQLYHILFKQVNENKKEMNIYINSFKSVTSKMVLRPLLYKHYMVNISFFFFFFEVITLLDTLCVIY